MSEIAVALTQLMELQKKDTGLDMLRAKLRAIPAAEQEVSAELSEAKIKLNEHREQQKKLALKHKEAERNLAECEELTRKHQSELNQVKSNDAFKALLHEIEASKKRAGELETEILSALEALDAAAAQEKTLAAEFKAVEDKTKIRTNELQAEKLSRENSLAETEKERAAFAAGLDAELLEKYEHIRKQRNGLAVCIIKEHGGAGSCGGCNMALRPQSLLSARKKNAITQCDNCQRILFVTEAQ